MQTALRERYYIEFNGTSYDIHTPLDVMKIMERILEDGKRVTIVVGDTDSGEVWQTHIGYVDKTDGEIQVPVIRPTKKGLRDTSENIFTNCILHIKQYNRTLYKHPRHK